MDQFDWKGHNKIIISRIAGTSLEETPTFQSRGIFFMKLIGYSY